MHSSRVCLPADGSDPVERLKIIIHKEQNPWEVGAWAAEHKRRMLGYFRWEMVSVWTVEWDEVEMNVWAVQDRDSSKSDVNWVCGWVDDTVNGGLVWL